MFVSRRCTMPGVMNARKILLAMIALTALAGSGRMLAQDGWSVKAMPNGYRVEALAIDSANTYWMAGHSGVASFDGNNTQVHFNEGWTLSLAVSPSGRVWAGTSAGLRHYDGTNWSDPIPTGSPWLMPIAVDESEGLWIGSPGSPSPGILHFDGTAWNTYKLGTTGIPLESMRVNGLVPSGNRVWIPTDSGLVVFDRVARSWTHYHEGNSQIPGKWISSLAIASDGKAWMLSPVDSLLIGFDGTTWTTQRNVDATSALAADRQGNIWFTRRDGLVRFDGTEFTLIPFPNPEFGRMVNQIAVDRMGRIVLGHTDFNGSALAGKLAIYSPGAASAPEDGADMEVMRLAASPNPAVNETNIAVEMERAGLVKLTLHDATGRAVAVLPERWLDRGRHHLRLPLEGLSSGAYFVQVVRGGSAVTVPVLKR